MYLAVGTFVPAIQIGKEGGRQKGMVEGRVKDPKGGFIAGSLHFAQFRIPGTAGILRHPVEIPTRIFLRQMAEGAIGAHRGDPGLDQKGFNSLREEELGFGIPACGQVGIRHQHRIEGHLQRGDGLRKLQGEVHALVVGPALAEPVTGDQGVGNQLDAGVHGLVPVDGETQVDDQGRPAVLLKGIAVHPGAQGGGEFGQHPGAVEQRLVVTRAGFFVGMAEPRDIGIFAARFYPPGKIHFTHSGHDQYVGQVADARAAEVQGTEPGDDAVRVLITGAPVPATDAVVGADLHHAAGQAGARVGMAVGGGSDERIDVSGVIDGLGLLLPAGCPPQQECRKDQKNGA